MTAKEKAEELIGKYRIWVGISEDSESIIEHGVILRRSARRCAIIAVDEIISIGTTSYFLYYWREVKSELEKL